MALRINFNYESAATHTALKANERLMNQSLLRLSTGLRILSAQDDAAGLFIADQLSVVGAGLYQGNQNIQTGLSALRIAENSAGQIFSKLQAIYTRAESAANDINDPNARSSLQQEITNFIDAIKKIATDTEYNGIKLLDGTFKNKYIHYGARKDQVVTVTISDLRAESLGAYTLSGSGAVTSNTGALSSTNFTGTNFTVDSGDSFSVAGQTVLSNTSSTAYLVDAAYIAHQINTNSTLQNAGIEATATNSSTGDTYTGLVTSSVATSGSGTYSDSITVDLKFFVGDQNDLRSVSSPTFSLTGLSPNITLADLVNQINSQAAAVGAPITASADNGHLVLKTSHGETIAVQAEVNWSLSASSATGTYSATLNYTVNLDQIIGSASSFSGTGTVSTTATSSTSGTATYSAIKVGALSIAGVETFQVNFNGVSDTTASAAEGLNLDVSSTAASATFSNLYTIDVSTNEGAEEALLIVKKAIQQVDKARSQIGAVMNNLQSIYDAQKTAYDNTKEAENVIRNVDYAEEMSRFTTFQIRMQSGIAMLAQANQLPQLVLQLLR
ncbi:flagellin [Thermosulfurimonas marina]|uniref:Flagellin n=1 Tax=Thermosulfurimonas marina TaxID=2047767 RepID=A0A6H1WTN3_9BACT|nr:flagellin [Thermosulfurimonas marina]QJA06552.1 flagellin [Thermosulfurimonas marina]